MFYSLHGRDETEAEKQELVIPLVQDDRAALLKRAQTLVEAATPPAAKKFKTGEEATSGNDDRGENKKGGGGETEATKKPLTLDEQAATALIEGIVLSVCLFHSLGLNVCLFFSFFFLNYCYHLACQLIFIKL